MIRLSTMLPALLAAPGRAQDRQALLLQSPPAGHSERPRRAPGRLLVRPAAQQLLGKVGLLHTAAPAGAEQRAARAAPSAQCDRAMPGRTGYLRALPSQAPRHCIYADPPYIFPGRSMNYYGTRRRGHDLAFHSELRDALFASGLPFLLSINDVPEAWELAGSITRLCSGKNSSKPELLVLHQGNPAVACCRSRIEAAILSPQQDCQAPPAQHPTCEFEGARRLSSFSKVHQDLYRVAGGSATGHDAMN